MLRISTVVVSLLAISHGFENSARIQAWMKDSAPFKSSAKSGSRIIGGEATTIGDHPYTVSLQHEWDEYQYDTIHFCTATIINENWMVTTAQCALLFEYENVTARVGSSYFHEGGTVHLIEQVVFHPEWDSNEDDYDMALLKLNTSLTFSSLVRSIGLPKANVTLSEGTEFSMASWGASYFMGDMTTELQEITMPTITSELCATVWGDRLTDRMFCAYKEEDGVCIGDTGTAAVVDGVLIGIVSFTYACSAYGYPTVYTDVSSMVEWITEITGSSAQTATISCYTLLATVFVFVKMRVQ